MNIRGKETVGMDRVQLRQDKKRVGRGASGSATVEMSILMPMLCVLILMLLYLGFYLYDRTVLYGDAYLAAYYGACHADVSNEEAYRIAEDKMQEQTEKQLIAMDRLETEITVTYDEVTVAYEGTIKLPIANQNPFFDKWNQFEIKGQGSVARHKPVTFIRQCRKLERLLKEEEEGVAYGNGREAD